jgi:hypothetical protein
MIGGGGHDVVFKGITDLKVVVIKKSRVLVQGEINEFPSQPYKCGEGIRMLPQDRSPTSSL